MPEGDAQPSPIAAGGADKLTWKEEIEAKMAVSQQQYAQQQQLECNLAAIPLGHNIRMGVSRAAVVYSMCTNPDLALQSVVLMRGIFLVFCCDVYAF